ncbi:amino acid ABC transporter permease [Radicibacter daui]|uniref:amino acid ABC transporter permease n=1 Tax=Radicibacter daui TaxID=3064829 RepID=UPI004046CE49
MQSFQATRLGVYGFLALMLLGVNTGAVLPAGLAANLSSVGLEGWPLRILGSLLITGALWLNAQALRRLPFRMQVIITWLELGTLFLLFFASFNLSWGTIWHRLPVLLGLQLKDGFVQGAAMTLLVSIASIVFASILAMIAALGRMSKNGLAFGIASFYISFFRGTPLLLQVLLIYLGLPQLDIVLDAVPAGIIALSLCYGAYMAEIFRAGIMSIPAGQREAAYALGLKPGLTLWLVVIPQALRVIIPPTGNQFISMLKDSALVSVMGVWELMYLSRTYGRTDFKYMEMMIAAALIYWALSSVFEILQARLEKKFGRGISIV